MDQCEHCLASIKQLEKECRTCGFQITVEPTKQVRERFLRVPSLGALLFTQGWTLGARLYLWFVISLIPIAGLAALVACVIFGRRWSWKYGGWRNWETFERRMKILDGIGIIWIIILGISYFFFKK